MNKHAKKLISLVLNAVLSGIMISVGGAVYLLCDNKIMGSFLFSFGLFTIVQRGFALYTGKVGYIPENSPGYILETFITLAGNIAGSTFGAILLQQTRFADSLRDKAAVSMDIKTGDSVTSQFILGAFCGMLMYLAVDNAISKRKCAWLLHSGAIPCTDSCQSTRRYSVKLDDVIEYIIRTENAAERVQPQRPPECFREQLNDVWFDVPDVLTITEVSAITGYTPNAVDRWIVKGSLRSVIVQTGLITCREWLIDFYCGDGYNIVKKVDKHLELLRKLI